MALRDGIKLGSLERVDLAEMLVEAEPFVHAGPRIGSAQRIRLSVALSVFIHLLLSGSLIYFLASEETSEPEVASLAVRISIVPVNPLHDRDEVAPPQERETVVEESSSPSSAAVEEPDTEFIALDEEQPQNLETAESTLEQVQSSDESAQQSPTVQIEALDLPSVDAVQQAIRSLERSDAARFYRYDCNKIEEERRFNDCAPQDRRDYTRVARNSTYESFQATLGVSRSRQTVTTLARNSERVAAALRDNELPAGISAYVLEEIELGIETYSNGSPRAVTHMSRMLDRSDAGRQASRVFDHWVQQRSAQLRARRVENNRDRLSTTDCASFEKFVTAPAVYTQCLFRGGSFFGVDDAN